MLMYIATCLTTAHTVKPVMQFRVCFACISRNKKSVHLSLFQLGHNDFRLRRTLVRGTVFVEPVSVFCLEKLTVIHQVKIFRAFHGIRRFTAVFTRAGHWTLS